MTSLDNPRRQLDVQEWTGLVLWALVLGSLWYINREVVFLWETWRALILDLHFTWGTGVIVMGMGIIRAWAWWKQRYAIHRGVAFLGMMVWTFCAILAAIERVHPTVTWLFLGAAVNDMIFYLRLRFVHVHRFYEQ